MQEKQPNKEDHNSLKDYFALGEVFNYYFRKKKQPKGKRNINLTLMHGINRIAIVIFLIAFLIWLVKRLA